MNAREKKNSASVSGPGIDLAVSDGPGVALSRAITAASTHYDEGTWYVRDVDGTAYARLERDGAGTINIFGPAMLAAERRRAEGAPVFTPGA